MERNDDYMEWVMANTLGGMSRREQLELSLLAPAGVQVKELEALLGTWKTPSPVREGVRESRVQRNA